MELVNSILPHLIWAVAAVVCVHKLVVWLKGADVKAQLASIRSEVDSCKSLNKVALDALGHRLEGLERRLDPLERIPAKKQVF